MGFQVINPTVICQSFIIYQNTLELDLLYHTCDLIQWSFGICNLIESGIKQKIA